MDRDPIADIGTYLIGGYTASCDGARLALGGRPENRSPSGRPATPFLGYGDRVRIEMRDHDGRTIFGAIEREVVRYEGPGYTKSR